MWSDKVDKLVEGVAPVVSEMDRKRLRDMLVEFGGIFLKIVKTLEYVGFSNTVSTRPTPLL